MRKHTKILGVFCCCALAFAMSWTVSEVARAAQTPGEKKPAAATGEKAEAARTAGTAKASTTPAPFIGTPDKIKWAAFTPGVEAGNVYGDCEQAGAPCVFQLRLADGAKFPAHWHPVDENVTVLSGTFLAGMGDVYDASKMTAMPAGTYVFMPRKMHHYAGAKGETVVQVHGVGPFKMMWVNPADDPARAAGKPAK